jgi:hypothetical protein
MCYEYSSWFRKVNARELAKARELKDKQSRAAPAPNEPREPAHPRVKERDKVPA